MQQAVQRARNPNPGPVIAAATRAHSARVNFGVDWEPRGEVFRSSLRDFLAGPRPNKHTQPAGTESLRIDFVERRLPLRGFAASCLWHAAAVWLLVLPIWGFLPKVQPTLQPPQIELTWYTTPKDLPRLLLPASPRKPARATRKPKLATTTAPRPPAEAYHPRQTILSVPVRATHPRQTLIQPDAPAEPPKMAPALPNIVQWTASEPAKLQMQLSQTTAAPRPTHRDVGSAPAPEIAIREDKQTPSIAAQEPMPKLGMPESASTAIAAKRRAKDSETAAAPAPDVEAVPKDDADLHRLIALSATPALPAPKVTIPKGNLAAKISMSPEGRKKGASSSATHGIQAIAAESPTKGSRSLPASISISDGKTAPTSGKPHPTGTLRRELAIRTFSRTDAQSLRPSGPAQINMAKINRRLPPEAILAGKQVYTMHVSMPNLTSASGSWILNFAELDSGDELPLQRKAALSGPEPVLKVDPKYPPELIREHIHGEVVLYAIIRANGSVDSIRVMRSLDPRLDHDAAAALAQWKFRPGTRAGVPVDVEAVVHIPFNYQVPEQ